MVDGVRLPRRATSRTPLASLAQRGDPFAFDQRQIAVTTLSLWQPKRRQPATLGAPAVARLATDPHAPTGLHRANPRQHQRPVLILDDQLPLPSPTSHLSPHQTRSVATRT